jgi:hypothetical protein
MAKDLIIGAFTNYEFDLLKPWINSIKESGFDGEIALVAINVDNHTIEQIERAGVNVIKATNPNNEMIHMLRFLHVYNYLDLYGELYRYVITTDVRDVIFQKNPSEYLQKVFGSKDKGIIAQSESIKIEHEAWNRDNIIKNFGHYFYKNVMKNDVYNVGILAGTTEYIKDLCFHLYQMSLNRPDWVADQAAYNMLLGYKPWSDVAIKMRLSDAWAVNAHVTNKPDQMEQFGPYLLENRPYMKDGIVYNSEGKPFTIVHQYDRVPEWMEFYMEKFQFSVKSDTNTGTSPKYFTYKI